MTSTFVRPISSRTRFSARHSRSKHGRNEVETYREAPRKPSIGFSSCGSYCWPPMRFAYSLVLKSERRTMTGLGAKAAAMQAMPSASRPTKNSSGSS